MSSGSVPLCLPLCLPLERASSEYTAVPGVGSPCSGGGSPTAREVRLECIPSSTAGAAEPSEGIVVEHPCRRGLTLLAGALAVLAVVAFAGAALLQVQTKPTAAAAPPRFQKIGHGSCESNGLLPVKSAHLCTKAARALGLEDVTVKEVPADAVAGLNRNLMDEMPQECYYLSLFGPETRETLWFNPRTPGSADTRASTGGPIKREPICESPHSHDESHASMAFQEEPSSGPWSLAKELPVPEALRTLLFGSTTATTTSSTQTATSTWTGTSTTKTSTTRTTSTSTVTPSTTSTVTTTSTFTTTYHSVPTLFCFTVMRVNSYELNNVRTAIAKKTSIFACDDYILFSDQKFTVQPGVPVPGWSDLQLIEGIAPVETTVLNHDLATQPKAGSLEGILNTQIFMQAWHQVNEDGRFRMHDWTIKVDPDAVFLPQRLVPDLQELAPASSSPNFYLVNCKISFGLFGAVEVFSRVALENYLAGEERCKTELDWTIMGEDLWMKRCLDLLGVQHDDDFHILSDGYCSEQASPCQSGKVAFHPFKSALSYLQCYTEAITPTTTSSTSTVTTSTVTTTTVTETPAPTSTSKQSKAHLPEHDQHQRHAEQHGEFVEDH